MRLIHAAAFLSFRGFNTSGITNAEALPGPARTHRERRALAASAASSAPRPWQAPNLKTVPPARTQISSPKASKVSNVKKVDAVQPLSLLSRLLRRKRLPITFGQDSNINLADIDQLRQDLGLLTQGSQPDDAVFVAIDTEGSRDAAEIGISTLDTRDIMGITPDRRAANWISKVKHQHIVIDRKRVSPWTKDRLGTALFCTSSLKSADDARTLVISLLKLARQPNWSDSPRKVHLVGQSIAGDVRVLKRGPNLRIDLSDGSNSDFNFDRVYDTNMLSLVARSRGALFRGMSLGVLAQRLGVDAQYWSGSTVRGVHNASNDAAYTMMVMLLFAVRWDELPTALMSLPSGFPAPVQARQVVPREKTQGRLSFSVRERWNWQLRKERLAMEREQTPRSGLLGKVERAIFGLIWGWR